jgi:hypothetical protein
LNISTWRGWRPLSVDSSTRYSLLLLHPGRQGLLHILPDPPPDASARLSASPLLSSNVPSSGSLSAERRDQSPAQPLSEFRNVLRAGLEP